MVKLTTVAVLGKRFGPPSASVQRPSWVVASLVLLLWLASAAAGSQTIPSQLNTSTTSDPRVTLSHFRGRWVVLDFFASWCDACLRDLPKEISDYHSLNDGTTLIGVDERESTAVVSMLVKSRHIPFEVLIDRVSSKLFNGGSIVNRRAYLLYGEPGAFGTMAQSFDVSYLPTHVLIDPIGNVVARWSASPPGLDELREQLRKYGLLHAPQSNVSPL